MFRSGSTQDALPATVIPKPFAYESLLQLLMCSIKKALVPSYCPGSMEFREMLSGVTDSNTIITQLEKLKANVTREDASVQIHTVKLPSFGKKLLGITDSPLHQEGTRAEKLASLEKTLGQGNQLLALFSPNILSFFTERKTYGTSLYTLMTIEQSSVPSSSALHNIPHWVNLVNYRNTTDGNVSITLDTYGKRYSLEMSKAHFLSNYLGGIHIEKIKPANTMLTAFAPSPAKHSDTNPSDRPKP